MTGPAKDVLQSRLTGLLRATRMRVAIIVMLAVLPATAFTASCAARFADALAIPVMAFVVLLAGAGFAVWRSRKYDFAWLARRLNSSAPELEDSADLAFEEAADSPGIAGLKRLQQSRLRQRLQFLELPDVRPPVPARKLIWLWLIAAVLSLAVLFAPASLSKLVHASAQSNTAADNAATALLDTTLRATPPAYTGLSEQSFSSLDAKLPADSRVRWALRLDHPASAVNLVFHDESRLALDKDGETWRGEKVIPASTLYRVEVAGAPAISGDRLYRIDAVPDRAPEVIVRKPEKTLSLLDDGQKSWELAFEARDDYGLGAAELSISLAQGSGEQIKVTEHKLTLDSGSDAHQRSYRKTLDLGELGFLKGDDLIVRLTVADNHTPEPNRTSSASFILRWPPPESKESEGMDGIVQKAMPAYFRSERQIIIDTEALLAERAGTDEKRFAGRADDLGVDQKVLRLRYGQFLGEEFEGGAEHAPPESPSAKKDDKNADAKGAKDGGASDSLKMVPPDHNESSTGSASGENFGKEGNVLAEYGHMHDQPEAATLLDPETKRILKLALNEMWQAELNLRQTLPDQALPFEYKALEYIKQVQQAERIYLARAGLDLPQVDLSRRLSGDRTSLTDRATVASAASLEDSPVPAAWQALADGQSPDFASLEPWVRAHQTTLPDALGVISAVDQLRRNPSCADCRADLKSRLWPLLPTPATAVAPRVAPDASGAAYLDALSGSAP